MPKRTTDRLVGYGIATTAETVQIPTGNMIETADSGEPTPEIENVEITTLIFIDAMDGHRVEIPLDPDGKQRLIGQLTGGIIIPGHNGGS